MITCRQSLEIAVAVPRKGTRAEMIFFLGLLSLFVCGPAGLIAWRMANTDLRKIRQGTMFPDRVSLVKAGRVLGVIGLSLFVLAAAVTVWLLKGGVSNFPAAFKTRRCHPIRRPSWGSGRVPAEQ